MARSDALEPTAAGTGRKGFEDGSLNVPQLLLARLGVMTRDVVYTRRTTFEGVVPTTAGGKAQLSSLSDRGGRVDGQGQA